MKRLLILLLFLPVPLFAQKVLKHTLIPAGNAKGDFAVAKITDHRLMFMNLRGLTTSNVILNALGDTLYSIPRRIGVSHLAKVNEQGVSMAFTFLGASGRIKGYTMDSNGVMIDSFEHYFGTNGVRNVPYLRDSYTDSQGNVVLHCYSIVGNTSTVDVVFHLTLNQFGQLVKYKEYGPTGITGSLREGSKLLVKDGKLWGFTTVVPDGIMGLGIDTAGLTGQSYYLSKTITTSSFFNYSVLPYKNNGYYALCKSGNKSILQNSDIGGQPSLVDSLSSGVFSDPIWVSADSTRISVKWLTNPREVTRVTENGTTLGFLRIREDSLMNMKGAFAFGDGSWIVISSNPRTLQFPGYPYMLTRISDMGYPYDPWKQQVVFRGVTGTANEQTHPTVLAYPNPTQDRLRFLGIAESSVRLIDATGKELLNQNLTEDGISIATLPRGLYRYLLNYRGKYYQGSVVRE